MRRSGMLLALALFGTSPMLGAQPATQGQSAAQTQGQAHGKMPADQEPPADHLTPAEERRAAAIARQTMSPFCPGRTLADCPSGYAAEWRADIRDMVARGMSASDIQKQLESRAGGNLSGSPNRDASYGLSIFFAVLALGVLGLIFLRLRSGSGGRSGPETSESGAASSRDEADEKDVSGSSKPASKGVKKGKKGSTAPMVDEARLDAELAAEDEGPID